MLKSVATAAALLLAAGCLTSPVTGRRQLIVLSKDQELALGLQAWEEFQTGTRVLRSGPAWNRVNQVGMRIAAATGQDLPWDFGVVDAPDVVNAFCLPGGKVIVYTGLLSLVDNDDQLAVVIGHELAHATCRHGAERVIQQIGADLLVKGADVLLGTQVENAQTRSLVLAGLGMGAQVGVLLPYSRSQEDEADEWGLRYMHAAGYDPHAAPHFWSAMIAQGGRPGVPEFLSTHPDPEKRLARMRALAAELTQP